MSFLSVGMLNTKGQHNKSLKPNVYRRDFQPHYASKGFGKCILRCWPGIGLAQASDDFKESAVIDFLTGCFSTGWLILRIKLSFKRIILAI